MRAWINWVYPTPLGGINSIGKSQKFHLDQSRSVGPWSHRGGASAVDVMVSDSPYQLEDFGLPARAGAAAGALASLVMLVTLLLLQTISAPSVSWFLSQWGSIVLPVTSAISRTAIVTAGLAIHVLVGTVLGFVYVTSQQQRIPVRGLVAVGIWYGLLIWLVGSLLAGALLAEEGRRALRSWPWLFACLTFGLSLVGMAILYDKQHPHLARTMAKD